MEGHTAEINTLQDQIRLLETGTLDNQGTISLYQALVNTGLAWKHYGKYAKEATKLIEMGLVLREQN